MQGARERGIAAYLIAVAAEPEEAGLRDDVPEDDVAVLAAGGEDGA